MMPTRPRVIYATRTGNGGFVQLTVAAARRAAALVQWPDALDPEDAPRIAWAWVRERTRYAKDRGGQWIRLPSALARDRVGDCKSSAVTIAALCAAAGWPVVLRFAGYRSSPHWAHVYAMADGVPVDPLLPFGAEVVSSRTLDVEL